MALQAPFGTDEQPSVAVKIVGGKRYEVNARNGGRYDQLARTPYKYSTRPPWYLDDAQEIQKSNKPHLSAISNVSSLKRHQRSLSEESPSERREAKQDVDSQDAVQFMLTRLLSQFPSSNFKEIYTDMAEYDPRLSGYISEFQVETSFKRHKFPVPSTVLKVVISQYRAKDNTNMINYESLIKYLFSFSQKASHVRKPSNEMNTDLKKVIPDLSANDIHSLTSPGNSDQSSYVSPRSLVKKAMDDREEAYLLVQIEQAFKTNGPQILPTLEQLHKDLSKLSNGTNYVKSDQIERTCSWLRVPLHHTLLEKILDRFDVRKNGKINWMDFIGFLEKGVPLSIQQSSPSKSTLRSALPFWESQTPLAPVQVSPRKGHQVKESLVYGDTVKDSPVKNYMVSKERKKWDTLNENDYHIGPSENSGRSYDILKVENCPNLSPDDTSTDRRDLIESSRVSGKKPDTTASKDPVETLEDKLERFSHLTEALLRSDVDKNGTLHSKDVRRIVNNYNLIYNLHFPRDKVEEIIQSCTVDNSSEVMIEELAKSLWSIIN